MPGKDATFTLCSFWLVINLALAGKTSEARESFDRICSYANDLGLLSEEIDPDDGTLLGNFPQAFAHLGLIRAALHIRDAESG
jgi:GH15 family glucan-1,4-alpha-glucosidase